ncbi:MAG: hypothetical protein WC867_08350 [Candidatus Pacearchaeota archaeon]|jgi:hypothetical protein
MTKEEFVQNYRENFLKDDPRIKGIFSKAALIKIKKFLTGD